VRADGKWQLVSWSDVKGLVSPLLRLIDPLILDLDGDGIELSALGVSGQAGASTVFFDFDGDGFKERMGWVSADDGMLALDRNNNGLIDDGSELFGQPARDGYEVLETFDKYADGVIDAKDEVFSSLRIWRDLDQDGITDAGELQTLAQAGITSISLNRTNVTGTNQSHDRGFQGGFTRTNGTTGTAETIYFQTDRRDTRVDPTPGFTLATGIDQLPQLPGSGQINSIAWKATQDATFRTAWTQLTDQAATLSFSELRSRFETLLLQWAGVEGLPKAGRGPFVDGQHLAFVEKYFGQTFSAVRRGDLTSVQSTTISPESNGEGAAIEATYDSIVTVMLTAFLAQTSFSVLQRGGSFEAALASPYLFYALLDFRTTLAQGEVASPTPGYLGAVVDLIKSSAPSAFGAAVGWYEAALSGLEGATTFAFAGSATSYSAFMSPRFVDIADPMLRQIATAYGTGEAIRGGTSNDGLAGSDTANVFLGGKGDDVLAGGGGSDIYIYARGDGNDWIVDRSTAASETDTLVLRDLNRADVTFTRMGNTLIVTVTATGHKITVADMFAPSGPNGALREGVESIRFADGSSIDRNALIREARYTGDSEFGMSISGSAGDLVLRGGPSNDTFTSVGTTGTDIIMFGRGDGNDVVVDLDRAVDGRTVIQLVGLNPDDVEIIRANSNGGSGDLLIRIKSTGETLRDSYFFYEVNYAGPSGIGIDGIRFANGIEWTRATIISQLVTEGSDRNDNIYDTSLDDTIIGGKGDDYVSLGSTGADTIVWKPGDGNDTYSRVASDTPLEVDTILLANTMPGDVLFSWSGKDVLITHKVTGELLTLSGFLQGTSRTTGFVQHEWSFQNITFGNGVTLNPTQVAARVGEDFYGFRYEVTSLIVQLVGLVWRYWSDEYGNQFNIKGTQIATPTGVSRFGSDVLEVYHINGTDGPDQLFGSGGVFRGHGGDDLIQGYEMVPWTSVAESLIGGSGNDTLDGGHGNDTLEGDSGADNLIGGEGNDILIGGSERDNLLGGEGDDTLDGGTGDDLLGGTGEYGSNIFIWGQGLGNDIILGASSSGGAVNRVQLNHVVGSNQSEADYSFTRAGNDLVVTSKLTGETLTVVGQYLSSSISNTIQFFGSLSAAEVAAQLVHLGTNGNDERDGTAFGERYDLGRGNDVMVGRDGSDVYVFRKDDGKDQIIESFGAAGDVDRVMLVDTLPNEIELSRNDSTLFIRVPGSDQAIAVANQFTRLDASSNSGGIEQIGFANGTVWDRSTIFAQAWFRGTDSRDTISTTIIETDDTFFGGLGDDTITSGGGSDTYIYRQGDGADVYQDSDTTAGKIDTLWLRGVAVNDVRLTQGSATSVDVTFAGSTGSIKIIDQMRPSPMGIDQVKFDDGTLWDRATLTYWATAGSEFYAAGSEADVIVGSRLNQRLSGNGGNDTIDGGTGSDTILGDAGNDTLSISSSNFGDTDALDGGAGVDTVSFASFGFAVLVDLVSNQGEARTSGGSSLVPAQLRTIASLRTLENITGSAFADDLSGDGAINSIVGGAGNDLIDGRSGDDILDGGDGDDTIFGGLDNDLLVGGLGADNLDGGVGIDTVSYQASHLAVSVLFTGISTGGHAQGDVLVNVEHVIGSGFADTINGDAGANQITGGAGNDTLSGGDGNDVFLVGVGAGRDAFDGGAGLDEIRATAANVAIGFSTLVGIETINGNGFANVTVAGDAAANIINLSGVTLNGISRIDSGAGNDTITGTSGADTIDGGTGLDSMTGGLGNDVYIVDVAGDVIIEAANAGTDEVRTALTTYTLGAEVENLTFTGTAAFTGTGNGSNNVLVGGSGADRLTGNAGNDTLNGGAGNDTLIGGTGDDVYVINSGTDTVIEAVGEGIDRVETSLATFTLAANVENLRATGVAAFTGVGNAFANVMSGTSANDILTGGLEADTLDGGNGSDVYVYSSGDGADRIDEGNGSTTFVDRVRLANLNAGDITLSRTGVDLFIRTNATNQLVEIDEHFYSTTSNWGIEETEFANGTVWGLGRINAVANGVALSLGTVNADTMLGTANADAMFGEAGNDIVNGAAGNDTIGGGDGNDTLNGQAGSDLINGENGNDTLRLDTSVAGDRDVFDGGSGTDVLDMSGFGFAAWVDFTAATEVQTRDGSNVTSGTWRQIADLVSVENVIGTAFADEIAGDALSNNLNGGVGNDRLNGRDGDDVLVGVAGSDTLDGGAGTDTASYAGAAAIILDRVIASNSTADAAGDSFTSIERFILTSNADRFVGNGDAESVDGGSGNDTLFGNGGDDVLNGGAGSDSLSGGAGNDTYVVDNISDVVSEAAGAGVDLVQSTVSLTFAAEVENLTFTGSSALNGIGNSLANVMTGNTGANRLEGRDGADTLSGGAGTDTLDGGLGNDSLTGGTEADVYVFRTGYGSDTIQDFSLAGGDVVELGAGTAFDTLAEVLAAASQVGADTVISLDANTSLTLKNIQKTAILNDDFRFVT
jgi:Ca2+-binding RTX toxin-like protein